MTSRETDLRRAIVDETYTWIATPYEKAGRVKGAGVDCAMLLACVMVNVGRMTLAELDAALADVGLYGHDWFHHATSERYFNALMRFAVKLVQSRCYRALDLKPGSFVLTKTRVVKSDRWNHGGVVTQWPRVVHAISEGVTEVDASRDPFWQRQEVVAFDVWDYATFGEYANGGLVDLIPPVENGI